MRRRTTAPGVRAARAAATLLVVALAACGRSAGHPNADPNADPNASRTGATSTASPVTVDGRVAPTTATTAAAATLPPAPPPPTLPSGPQEVVRGDPNRQAVALTFDCGASAGPTPAILDALRAAGVRVTFFLTGQWVDQNPDLARAIAADHELANHTYTHRSLTSLTDAEIVDEMERAEAAIERVTGRGTKPLWRAPYGARDARVLRLVADAGWHLHVFWSADTLDWQDIPPEQVLANLRAKLTNGAIVLQHCGSAPTAAVLADELRELANTGYAVVTISELLGG